MSAWQTYAFVVALETSGKIPSAGADVVQDIYTETIVPLAKAAGIVQTIREFKSARLLRARDSRGKLPTGFLTKLEGGAYKSCHSAYCSLTACERNLGTSTPPHVVLVEVEALRKQLGMSKHQMCELMGVTRSAIYHLEDGRKPNLETLDKIRKFVKARRLTEKRSKNKERCSKNPRVVTGEKFKARREALGYSLTDLSVLMGVTRGSIARWEAGDPIPKSAIQSLLNIENGSQRIALKLSDLQSRLQFVLKEKAPGPAEFHLAEKLVKDGFIDLKGLYLCAGKVWQHFKNKNIPKAQLSVREFESSVHFLRLEKIHHLPSSFRESILARSWKKVETGYQTILEELKAIGTKVERRNKTLPITPKPTPVAVSPIPLPAPAAPAAPPSRERVRLKEALSELNLTLGEIQQKEHQDPDLVALVVEIRKTMQPHISRVWQLNLNEGRKVAK